MGCIEMNSPSGDFDDDDNDGDAADGEEEEIGVTEIDVISACVFVLLLTDPYATEDETDEEERGANESSLSTSCSAFRFSRHHHTTRVKANSASSPIGDKRLQ